MSRKLIALLSSLSLILSFSVLPVAADHDTSKDQDPELISGNPSCATVYESSDFVFEVKIEPVDDSPAGGDPYSFNGFLGTIILTVDEGAKTFDYTITGNAAAIGVIVKGGPNANWYDYSGIGAQTSDVDLHAPSRGNGLFGLSHISFCMVDAPKDDPSVATTSSETGTVLPGTSVTDTATVTGVAGGPVPTGDVTFFLCQPTDVTAAGCPDGSGTQVGLAIDLGASDGEDPASASATSSATTDTTTEGKYCWRADYSGDGNYNSASHTNAVSECFTVAKNQPDLDTAPWVIPQDDATVADLVGDAFGDLEFELFDNIGCSGEPVFSQTIDVTGDRTYSTSNSGDSAVNDGFKITADGTFYWVVTYTGDANNAEATSDCGDEILEVDITPDPDVSG